MTSAIFPSGVRLRPVAIPMEHGGWGFVLEPIVLGLLLAPSWAGALIAIAALAGFLVRQPLKVWWSDVTQSRRLPRTSAAIGFIVIYSVVGAAAVSGALLAGKDPLIPLALAAPLVVVLLVYDARSMSRELVPELLAPVALASVASGIVLAGGRDARTAFAVWVLLSSRAIPSVLYVRSRLRLEYGKDTSVAIPVVAHVAAAAVAAWIGVAGLSPLAVVPLYLLLLGRAIAGLSPLRRRAMPKVVGYSEIGWGVLSVFWIAGAWWLA